MSAITSLISPAIATAQLSGAASFVARSSTAWPGRESSIILLAGCNLRCPYCCCPELLGSARSPIAFDRVLDRCREYRHALGGVVVSGGEPTAHPALIGLLRELRALGIPVRLDSNGTFPDVLEEVLSDRLVSFVALDVKTTPLRYDAATGSRGMWDRVSRSIRAVIDSGVDHEFRTTCYPSALTTADLPSIAKELEGGSRYVIQQFRPVRTLDPAASSVRPYAPEALRRAALCCAVHLPTVVRGV
jgi:pyruvate formate lyase activating enzyme